eukprot:jgi/Galph1/5114/GphlegSOOS_G3718.1
MALLSYKLCVGKRGVFSVPFILQTHPQLKQRKGFPCQCCKTRNGGLSFLPRDLQTLSYRRVQTPFSLKLYVFYPVLLTFGKHNSWKESRQEELGEAKSFLGSEQVPDVDLRSGLNSHNSKTSQNGTSRSFRTRRRKPHSLQTRKKISQSLKGRSLSGETKKKISQSMKGKKFTASHRFALSQRMQGPLNPMYGKRMSAETKLKISRSIRKLRQQLPKVGEDRNYVNSKASNDEKGNNAENVVSTSRSVEIRKALYEKYQDVLESLNLEDDKEGLELIGKPPLSKVDEGRKRKLKMIQKSVKKRLREVSSNTTAFELDEGILVDDNVAQKFDPKIEYKLADTEEGLSAEKSSSMASSSNPQNRKEVAQPNMVTCQSCSGRGIKACDSCIGRHGIRSAKCTKCLGSGIMFCSSCNGSGEVPWEK